MERRELLKMIALATGSVMIGSEFLLSGCTNNKPTNALFSNNDILFLDEVGETIIPATSTPGAKAAEIGKFMQIMVTDCYTETDQKAFVEGIKKLDEACNKMHNTSFMKATSEQRKTLLIALDKEAKVYQKEKGEKEKDERAKANKEHDKTFVFAPNHYFTMMKQLTLYGFFTSKPGATQAIRYVAVPGKWEACIPYKKGDKVWAT
ncbi:MAG: gluconate 2-dehydrogenase subunit 3 family protein [Bacteroidetes bacterium]|nr:gluconate 2-dehydrogenase subunit 3 family protein [Bacteroidota bacterium]MBS1591185.1 gluconate 2-dehydrogenase subunit 3 family protein [Bacteroidota bacterium]MBS1639054.1 gluconate 2-dehydrogenase subunit 3 family protein [Bacteroidota bacterium]MBS1641871.1 gluconate 2-dehydrogenase subunit 3 family protein [Bacteroidota bacterium]MBS1670684.1 gluconate 2-dehydrogenase subunit 3 family protein [Bacteroidota bacterium]